VKSVCSEKDALVIFAKEPRAGECKRRLAQAIGSGAAKELYAAFLEDTLKRLEKIKHPAKIIAFTPDSAEDFFKSFEGAFSILPQGGGDLGERMRRAFIWARENGFKRTVIVGSDVPDVPLDYIRGAFRNLSGCDIVLGPAADGGYYLIGMKEPFDIFSGIAWGTNRVRAETLARAARLGLGARDLPVWSDVDNISSLRDLAARLVKNGTPVATDDFGKTKEALKEVFARGLPRQ